MTQANNILDMPRPKRDNISAALRFGTLEKCKFACHYCGIPASEAFLVIDHVTPVSAGGLTEADNLVAACEPCNIGKASRLVADLPSVPAMLETVTERTASGRPRNGTMQFNVRLQPEIASRIDDLCGGKYRRSAFIREAIQEKLERVESELHRREDK